jgi:hypothetical protein
MKTRDAILKDLEKLITETESLNANGSDPLLTSFSTELRRYLQLATDHWPLSDAEKATVDIGRVAVRELYAEYPEYVTRLSQTGAALRAAT